MTTIVLTTKDQATVTLTPLDSNQKPSQIEAGSLNAELIEGGAAVEVLSDNQVRITHVDLGGELTATSRYFIKGDPDLTSGVAEIYEELVIIVTVPQAVGFGTEVTVEPIV